MDWRRAMSHGGIVCLTILGIAMGARAADPLPVEITFIGQLEDRMPPLSLVDELLDDEGLLGARQAVEENRTTGGFLGHDYSLEERVAPVDGDVVALFEAALAEGERLFVVDLPAATLVALAPLADAADAVIFNSRAPDDRLRTEECFASVLHTAPSRAMLADALAQYLVWKRWMDWVLVHGSHPEDELLAAAYRRAATRYGARIVEEREYEDTGAARRTDTGHVQVQRQMPVFTQSLPAHDVLLVADEADVFGEYLPYLTWDARPVVGSAGLTPTVWSRVHEQWGGTQLQRRFERFAGRPMTSRDFNAWVAVRAIGEAVTRASTNDPAQLKAFILSDAFGLAAFKGEAVTFRHWNQQLRQPILLTTPRMLVSVSPQEQFLHQRTPLDTLGYDEPETTCTLN